MALWIVVSRGGYKCGEFDDVVAAHRVEVQGEWLDEELIDAGVIIHPEQPEVVSVRAADPGRFEDDTKGMIWVREDGTYCDYDPHDPQHVAAGKAMAESIFRWAAGAEDSEIRAPRDEFEAGLFRRVIAATVASWDDSESRIHVGDEPSEDGTYPLTITKRVPFNPRRYLDAPAVEGSIWLAEHFGHVKVMYSLPGHAALDADEMQPSQLLLWSADRG